MKRENPRFHPTFNTVSCEDCPFADEDGVVEDKAMTDLCNSPGCPEGPEGYAEACRLAELEAA